MDNLAKRPWLVALLVTVWSIACHGYRFGVVNHGMQVPLMRMVAGDTCFAHDAFMQAVSKTYTTVFFLGVGELSRLIPLEPLCFVLFVAMRFGSVALAMRLGKALTGELWVGVVTAIFVSSQTLTFAEDMISDVYLNHDALSQVMTLGVLVLAVEKRYALALFLGGLMTPVHPLHAAHLVPLLALALLGKAPLRSLVAGGALACLGVLPTVAWMRASGTMGATYPPGWVDFARAWFPTHYFPLNWSLFDWLMVLAPVVVAPAAWRLAGKPGLFGDDPGGLKRLFVLAVVLGLGAGFVCEVWPNPFLIRLHPMRASFIAWLALLPYLGAAAVALVKRASAFDRTVGVVVILAVVLSVFGRVPHFLVLAPAIWACAVDKRRRLAAAATVALAVVVPAAVLWSKSLAVTTEPFWQAAVVIDGVISGAAALSVAVAALWTTMPPSLVLGSGAATAAMLTVAHVLFNIALATHGPAAAYSDVERWLKDRRPPGETVLVPLERIGIRAFSCQTPALDFEDGLASYHDPRYIPILEKKLKAYGWTPGAEVHGFSFLNHLSDLDDKLGADDLRRIGSELGANVAVRDKRKGEKLPPLPVLYENRFFAVLDVSPPG